MSKKFITKKELAPGIVLHKIVTPSKEQDVEFIYEFRLEVSRLNNIEFTVDFTGSENIILESSKGLIKTTLIQAFEIETVGVLRMVRQWSLKSKFWFAIKQAPRSIQEDFLKNEILDLHQKYSKSLQVLGKISTSICPLIEIENLVYSQRISFIDIEFPPFDRSIYSKTKSSNFDQFIHWRRPSEYLKEHLQEDQKEIRLLNYDLHPMDIHEGILEDSWFTSALACVAERPGLIKRLFITKEANKTGIYRVKLCKNGEWVSVAIDDYFPCYPMGQPAFSRCESEGLWVEILEKAYAKLHGNYLALRQGSIPEALADLTGCPVVSYDFQECSVSKDSDSNLWMDIKDYYYEGFLMCVSRLEKDKNRSRNGFEQESGFSNDSEPELLLGYGYSVISIKEISGLKLVNLRNPWGKIKWAGDWSYGSPYWTYELKKQINPFFDENNSNFWVSFQELTNYFSLLHVCKVGNWQEVRIKGKFIRTQNSEDPNLETVISKWFYSIDLAFRTRLSIGLHQEDEKILGVAKNRGYLDVGIVVLKRLNDGTVTIINKKDLVISRQCEIEMTLDPGSYIILPRTSGCLLKKKTDLAIEKASLILDNYLTEEAESVVSDIFRRFDLLLNRELSYAEFRGFYEYINKSLTEHEFKQKILKNYCSSEKGLTLKGFKDFFIESIKTLGENTVWNWIENLGYDSFLNSVKSRCFMITFHSDVEIIVTVRDAVHTEIDSRTNIQLIERFGKELESRNGVKCFYYFSPDVQCYSYGIYTELTQTVEIFFDCAESENMIYSSKAHAVKKKIVPGQMEFFMHSMANPNGMDYIRISKYNWHDSL